MEIVDTKSDCLISKYFLIPTSRSTFLYSPYKKKGGGREEHWEIAAMAVQPRA